MKKMDEGDKIVAGLFALMMFTALILFTMTK